MIPPRWFCIPPLLALALIGCSASSPISTPTPQAEVPAPADLVGLGLFELTLDASTLQGSLTPVQRDATALGDELMLDASRYFATAPGGPALTLAGIGVDAEGVVLADIAIRHPIPLPDPANPKPSDRLDLHLFDVLGVLILDGPAMEFGPTRPKLVPGVLANAHGYTGLLSPSFALGLPTEATAHPYLVLSLDTRATNFNPDVPSGWTDLRNPVGHNVLPQGSGPKVTRYKLKLPLGEQRMLLAVQATIQKSSISSTSRLEPIYALPEGNQKAAFGIVATLYNNRAEAGVEGSFGAVEFKIYDWQQSAPVTTPWVPPLHKTSLREESGLASVGIVIPGLGASFVYQGDSFTGDGSIQNPLTRHVIALNTAGAAAGDYWGLITTNDSRGTVDAIGRDGAPITIEAYRTYQVFPIRVHDPAGPVWLQGIRLAARDELFLGASQSVQLQVTGEYSDGSEAVLSGASFEVEDPDLLALDSDGWITRLGPRDTPSLTTVVAILDTADGQYRTWCDIVMGDPYADAVADYSPSCGASGIGADSSTALGGPLGSGSAGGNTTDVASLGYSGSMTLEFTDGWALDKPGADFIVFENAFEIAQVAEEVFTETVLVEVSTDGDTWFAFPTDYRADGPLPWRNPANFSGLAGVHPVLANIDENTIDPQDPTVAGGDAFDLADVGLEYARFIRLTATGIDSTSTCFPGCPEDTRMSDEDGDLIDDEGKRAATCSSFVGGPDIDAIAIVAGHQGFPE